MRVALMTALAVAMAGCGGDAPTTTTETTMTTQATGPRTPSAAAPGRSARRAFGDWDAVCDNGGRCMAYSGTGTGGWLAVRVDAGSEAQPEILMDLSGISGVPIRLVIDGRPQTLSSPGDGAVGFSVRTGDAQATLARLAAAREIQLIAPDVDAQIPSAGTSAALLWIDERQGRLGTTTALLRRGDRPASTVPAPPALPVVAAAPAVSQTGFGDGGQTLPAALEVLPAVKACRSETRYSEDVTRSVMSARLDASTELWAVPCFSGAYNVGHDWYVTGPGGRDPRVATLTSAVGEASKGTVNGGYSAETRTISAFSKGRGLGDCGTASTWTWTGRTFVLTAESSMEDCEGIPADAWPTTWRTR